MHTVFAVQRQLGARDAKHSESLFRKTVIRKKERRYNGDMVVGTVIEN